MYCSATGVTDVKNMVGTISIYWVLCLTLHLYSTSIVMTVCIPEFNLEASGG